MSRAFSLYGNVRWYRIAPGDGTSYRFGIFMIPPDIGRDIVLGCPDGKYAMLIPANPGVVFDAPMIAFRDYPPSRDVFNKNGVQVCSHNNEWTMDFVVGIWMTLMQELHDSVVLERAEEVIAGMHMNERFLNERG
jgi:hypothetical protein